jgi:hypothetical protein
MRAGLSWHNRWHEAFWHGPMPNFLGRCPEQPTSVLAWAQAQKFLECFPTNHLNPSGTPRSLREADFSLPSIARRIDPSTRQTINCTHHGKPSAEAGSSRRSKIAHIYAGNMLTSVVLGGRTSSVRGDQEWCRDLPLDPRRFVPIPSASSYLHS